MTDIHSQIFSPDCKVAGIFLPGMPPCNNGNYYLSFEDNFDGNSLDLTKWDPTTGVPRDFNFTQQKAWHQPENLEVSNGTLKITAKKLTSPYTGTWVTDWSTNPPTTQTSTFDYTTGELWTKQTFLYGKYEIRCRLPNGKGFFPAFWAYGGQRWNELDIFDCIEGNDEFFCGPGYDFDGDGEAEGCRWSTDNIPDFSEWHIFTCIYDFDRIIWQIDGNTVRTLYRYYTVTGYFITCGEDIATGVYFQGQYFPVEEMHIVMNLAIRSGDKAPDANTIFPSYYEVDYVRFYIKSENPPCDGCLDHIVYENTDQLPTMTRASNYIQADNNVTVKEGQNVSFKAPSVELLPGFSVEAGANFEVIAEECNLLNYTDVPIHLIGSNAINNYQIDKCTNPLYSIEATGVLYYSVRIYTIAGQLIHSANGIANSNHISLWNAVNAAEAWYKVQLELLNCSDSDVREYNILVTHGSCRIAESSISDTTNTQARTTNAENIEQTKVVVSINQEFLIYPNPTNEKLNVFYSLNNSTTTCIVITDISGKEIFREESKSNIGANKRTIDTSQFQSGTYILSIISGNEKIAEKFIISK